MSSTINDEFLTLSNDDGIVTATIHGGTFQEEKRILATLKNLGDVIESKEKVRLVLDMSSVDYLSSAGLGRLVALLKKAMNGGGCLHLAGLRPEIKELFEVMRLTQIFQLFDDADGAFKAFDGGCSH